MASCPICKKTLRASNPPTAPQSRFCSERCRLIDLGNWLDGRYVVTRPAPSDPTNPDGEPDEQELLALLRDLQ